MQLPYWMLEYDNAFYLCAEATELEAIQQQLARYREENKSWPPQATPFPPDQNAAWLVPFGYCVALVLIYMTQQKSPNVLEDKGAMQSTHFLAGQGWRAITALTLHGNLAHLMANLLALFCFGLLVNRTFRAGIGWCCMLLSGALGNTLTAALYATPHRSLGASTAIFGAIGMLIGHAMASKFATNPARSFRHQFVPLLAGLFLLASLGSGGAQTDVLAHVFGFIAGVFIGGTWTWLSPSLKIAPAVDNLLLMVPPLAILICWWLALTLNTASHPSVLFVFPE